MNPIYKFELTAGETTQRAYPIYNGELSKNFEKESGQEFFRAKLSGELTFESADYTFIVSKAFDTQFVIEIFISYNAGNSWESYWRGTFWKTDCEFDGDAQTVAVKPTVYDQYNDILAGLDKEFDLIQLAPAMNEIKADKRPAIQVYVPNQSVIGCFLSGMWWEQQCEPVSDTEMVELPGGGTGRKLEYYYHFAINKSLTNIRISGTMSPQLPEMVSGVVIEQSGKYFNFDSGGFSFARTRSTTFDHIRIYEPNTGAAWANERVNRDLDGNYTVTVFPVDGTPATGNVTLDIETIDVYSRYLCDVEAIGQDSTYPIPNDDFVGDNRNYRRVIGYQVPTTIAFSDRLTTTPTQWGLYQPGQYYQQPYSLAGQEFFPVARNDWGRISVWFVPSVFDSLYEQPARQPFTIRHAYPLWSVLRVLLAQISPNVTFIQSAICSKFLYSVENPITGLEFELFITPKSNIVTAGYDQPAQKAPITLRNVLDMLRNCFRCYWYVEDGFLKIEHIAWFMNGGAYPETPDYPVVGINLTERKVTRNGKEWDFASNKFKFDKPEMAARYQFGWMDDVTQLFEGFPIDIISKYVNPDNIEEINVQKFTSDIDYILLNPNEISKDGFVLLASTPVSWQETLNQPAVYSWNGGVIQTLSLQAYRGKTMRITVYTSATYLSISQIGAGFSALVGEINNEPNTNKTFEFIVDQNADYIGLYIVQPGGVSISSLQYMVGQYELPYVNYMVGTNEHYLQNAYVAFCMLQSYYAYDMPARNYSINGVPKVALGIKKLKTQTISFPALTDPEMPELVKTNLGNGMIQKLSINLSSRNVNATLVYDTE